MYSTPYLYMYLSIAGSPSPNFLLLRFVRRASFSPCALRLAPYAVYFSLSYYALFREKLKHNTWFLLEALRGRWGKGEGGLFLFFFHMSMSTLLPLL